MRSVGCPYCERRFWIDEQAVSARDARSTNDTGKIGEIQITDWHERSVRGYAEEHPSLCRHAIQLEAVNDADGARRRFEVWERREANAHGHLLTINGWTAQGKAKKKDFKIGKKGLFTVNKGNGRDGKSWTKLSALELQRRRPKNSALVIDKGSEEESEGWLLIRLKETNPALLDARCQMNEPLVKEMIQAWAICWDPDYLH